MIQRHLLSFVPLASISSSHWDLTTVRSSTLFFVGNNRREFPSITGLSLENGDSTINNVSTHIHSQETTDNDQDESRTQQTQTSIKTNNTNRNKTKKPPTTRTKYARKKIPNPLPPKKEARPHPLQLHRLLPRWRIRPSLLARRTGPSPRTRTGRNGRSKFTRPEEFE
mmetsp:Transcript_2338/g.4297  ORF Transcript_2338/g.4297 Transcript_2338/m.4297 type:complete len:168 (-) Transcript_2338:581-1084(-)